jgi:thiaminase/transcriptional activator TenA
MERFAELARATLVDEMELHRSFAREWGIHREELERERPTPTTRAYADFLVRTAATGEYGELLAALLPCMWGYSELGRALAAQPPPPEPRYAAWIASYASEEFAELARWCREALDEVGGEEPRLQEAFVASSAHELAFWDASWRRERPLGHANLR